MNSSSSDSSSDEDVLPGQSNFIELPSIPRTNNQHFYDDPDDLEEDYHEAFPISNFVPNFYPNFMERENLLPEPFFIIPPYDEELTSFPNTNESLIEGIFIHLLDFAILSDFTNKKSYIHSWYDLASGTSIEAKRIITSFFVSQYEKIYAPTKDKKESNLPQFSWGTSINPKLYSKPMQATKHPIRIFHYVGLGFPPPKTNEIFLKDNINSKCNYTQLDAIKATLKPPCMLIFDCDKAAILRYYLLGVQRGEGIFEKNHSFFSFFACSESEDLRIPSNLPQNFFTCILLTPSKSYSKIMSIEINDEDQFYQFLNIFTESIALDQLNTEQFHLLFRSNPTISTLWRRLLLSQRLMKRLGLHCQSIPIIPDTSEHHLWGQFDYAMRCIGKGGFDTLKMFSDLYQHHFTEAVHPPQFVCAFVTSLLKIASLKSSILHLLAKFMRRSPANCRIVRTMLDYSELGAVQTVIRTPLLKHWCEVMSGSFMIDESLASNFAPSYVHTQEMIKATISPNLDEKTRVLLLTILSCMKDSQSHISMSEDRTKAFLASLFVSSPKVRLWLTIFLYSAMSKYQAEPRLNGPIGLHAHMAFLMYDFNAMTRAFAIAMLTTMMAPHCPEFNENAMECALKGAIDGSSDVRTAFLYCAARYVDLNNDACNEEGSEKVENILRNDPIAFAKISQKPKIRALVKMLTNDPIPEIREIAKKILSETVNSGLEVRYRELAANLHERTHASLFTKDFKRSEMRVRYYDTLFNSNELELFETIEFKPKVKESVRVNAIAFYPEKRALSYGTAGGEIIFGDNHWLIHSAITGICHFSDKIIAVSANDGAVHVFRSCFESQIDAFLPSILSFSTKVEMVSDNKKMLYVSQDSNEIAVWNLLSLLLIDIVKTESRVVKLAYAGGFVYAWLANGCVLKINENSLKIENVSRRFLNQSVLNMRSFNGYLWTVTKDREVFVWENFDEPKCVAKIEDEIKFITVSNSFSLILAIYNDGKVRLTNFVKNSVIELPSDKKNPVCCTIDLNKPLAAVGYEDGSVAIWRIPL